MHCWPHDGIADAVAIHGLEPVAAAAQLDPEEVIGPVPPDVGVAPPLDPPPEPPVEQEPPATGLAELHAQTASADD